MLMAFLSAFIPAVIGVLLLMLAYYVWLVILAISRTLTKKGNNQ